MLGCRIPELIPKILVYQMGNISNIRKTTKVYKNAKLKIPDFVGGLT